MKKLLIAICLIILPCTTYAHKLTIIYTGNSYASLYPCGHCPASVGGGIARRAAVIADIKAKNPNVLILDAGNFTAGGLLDEGSLNPRMDEKRSIFNYSAMQAMGYDAVTPGESEFNFGANFFKNNVKKNKFKTISTNLNIEGVLPYYMKQFKSFNVGVIGLSPQSINKTVGLNAGDYDKALTNTLAELKGKVDFIILLSSLGDTENSNIAKKFSDIKLILSSGNILDYFQPEQKIGETIIVRPSYLAKDVRVIDLDVKLNKIISYKLRRIPLSLTAKENQQIKKTIPACFKDSDCSKKEGFIPTCQNPGELTAACAYFEPQKIDIILITDTNCQFCVTQFSEKMLQDLLMGVNFTTIDYKSSEAADLINKYSITTLPAFILPEDVKKNPTFLRASAFFEEKNGKILARPDLSGIFLFLDRKEIPNRIDLFINPYQKAESHTLEDLRQFCVKKRITLDVHLVISKTAKNAGYPQEEKTIAYAVKKVFPNKFPDYLIARFKDIKNKSYVQSLETCGIDYKKIMKAADSKEVANLILQNDKMMEDLNITSGNVILVNNNRIFKVFEINPAQLEKLFPKK